jgi:hypothetical protein
MSKSHRLAWAAGFIDGDGFITIQQRNQTIKDKQYKGHYLRIGACQASELPLKELQNLFGGQITVKNSGPNREGYNRKTQYLWNISTAKAAEVLEQLLPYLIHKKEVALIALEFQKTMSNFKVSDEVWQNREEFKQKIQTINSLS